MAIPLIARVILSALFAYAGVVKIIDPAGMRATVEAYQIVTGPAALAIAYFLPWLELWAAVALWFRPTRAAGSLILSGLLVAFIAGVVSLWVRGISIACGCFGTPTPGEISDYRELLLRDAGLLILALYTFYTSIRRKSC